VVPWAEQRQIEQDRIISRAIVDLFADPLLREQLRFRGGTALNKLHFPAPLRYSEDIDLVRTTAGPIGPILDRGRERLEQFRTEPGRAETQVSGKDGLLGTSDRRYTTAGEALLMRDTGAGR
jgi:predicted nucleotidyltransferase component of viral defense system